MASKKIDGNTIVYSAAAWWRDNDPSMQAVALTSKRVEKEIEKQMREAARWARDDGNYETIREALGDIAWSGVHTFALKDLASSRELREAIDELEDSGVWYPPTP
jgi:hypothetical protein